MTIKTDYDIKESVFLKTDKEQQERIITGMNVRESGITYELSVCDKSSWHYGFEIRKEAPKSNTIGLKR